MDEKPETQHSPVLARLKDPLVWARLSTGIRIEDLHERRYNDALDLIRNHFIHEETMCRSVKLSNEEDSIDCFLDAIRFWMRDTTSLVAVEEGTGVVVGVLVNRVVERLDRTRTFSRIRIMEKRGEAFMKVMQMRWHLHKTCDVFERYEVDKYFRFYGICVHPDFRGRGVGMGLMKSGVRVAELLNMPVAMGIFTSARSQRLAFKIGMEKLFELKYGEWKENNEAVFNSPGVGNYSAMVMGVLVQSNNPKPLSLYHDYESKLDKKEKD